MRIALQKEITRRGRALNGIRLRKNGMSFLPNNMLVIHSLSLKDSRDKTADRSGWTANLR